MIVFKEGVRIKKYTFAIEWILSTLRKANRMPEPGEPVDIVVTSVNDSQHGVGSKHYKDEAVDVRSRSFSTETAKERFRYRLEIALNCHETYPNSFRVLYERDNPTTPQEEPEHFHIQVKKGLSLAYVDTVI